MVRPSKGGKGKQNQRPAAASRPQNKGGAKNARKAPVKQVEEDDSEDENFLTFNGKGKGGDSDEDSEEEVFNINTKKNKSAKDSDDDDEDNDSKDEEDDDDDDDQDDYDEDEYDRLNQLVHNLPSDLKRGILNKKQAIEDDEDDDDEDDEDDPKSKKWGKKKTYWTGDTADLEIGQEIEDAYAEEEAAKELQQQKLKRMKKKDFYDDLEASDDDEDEEEEEADENANADVLGNRLDKKNKKNQQKSTENKKASSTKDKIAKELEAIVVDGNNDMNDIQTEQLAKDISSFTKDQKLELLATHAPELISIIRELRERIDELLHKINPIKTFLNKVKELKVEIDDDLVDYIEMKQQLLLSYCLNVVYYLSLKTMGKSVRNHPVMKQLLKLRYAMEKINSLDGKLKYQIDRLLKLSEEKTSVDDIKSGLLRPNLSSFLSNDDKKSSKKNKRSEEDDDEDEMDIDDEEEDDFDDEEEEDDDEDAYNQKKSKKGSSKKPKYADDSDDNDDEEVYRPPKLSATHYPDEKALEREDRQLQKKRNKLKNSELMETLREEFGNTPEMVTSTGNSALNTTEYQKLKDTEAERLKFEEERFVRTTLTRQEKKEMKKRLRDVNRIDTLDDIGDYEDLEEISKMMVPGSNQPSSSSAVNKSSAMTSSKALEQAMKVFSGKAGKSSKASALDLLAQEFHQGGDNNDDEEEERHSKRRRAPAPGDDDDDDYNGGGGNVFDDFIDKKKEFLAKKKEHYTAEARYGGMEEKVHEGDKRAISYEIMKNRGLTAHKSKANRNPRVKKREAYDKAVKARKGQVRDVIKGVEDNYGGELSGIKANLSRSRKVKS